jgi:hypothetical protein
LDNTLIEEFMHKLHNEQQRELPKLEDASTARDSSHEPEGVSLNDNSERVLGI